MNVWKQNPVDALSDSGLPVVLRQAGTGDSCSGVGLNKHLACLTDPRPVPANFIPLPDCRVRLSASGIGHVCIGSRHIAQRPPIVESPGVGLFGRRGMATVKDAERFIRWLRKVAPKGRSTREYIDVFGGQPIRPLVAMADELLEGEKVLIYPSPSDRTRFRFKVVES